MSDTAIPESFRELERSWRPNDRRDADLVTSLGPRMFSALLDEPCPVENDGDPLPPLWHWFLFPRVHARSDLAEDGHPAAGDFIPPLPERRRLFGGGRLSVHRPIRCGETVERLSSLASIRTRVGGSGPLLLVTLRHEFIVDDQLCIEEEQDVIYRQASHGTTISATAPASAGQPPQGLWRLDVRPDPVLLFRFSALTHNAHRIHYDRVYSMDVEGHPGLVVHGPLLALLLLELPRRWGGAEVATIRWRAHRPIYGHETVEILGEPSDTGAELGAGAGGDRGRVCASVTFRPSGR